MQFPAQYKNLCSVQNDQTSSALSKSASRPRFCTACDEPTKLQFWFKNRQFKNDLGFNVNARFEIPALFQPPVRREKKRANFKICIDVVYPESFLYWLYCISRKFLGFQGVRCNMILLYFLWICFESKSVKRSTRRWKIVSKEVLISIINELQLYFSILN